MRVSLLCLCLFSVAYTEAETVFQSHSGKTKENCVKHHKILVRGHNLKHGYYIFKYVYASSIQKNQTVIKKEEENNKSAVSTQQFNMGDELTKLTEDSRAQERGEDQKYIPESGIDRTSANRSISESRQEFTEVKGNTSIWDILHHHHHHHLEVIIHKNDTQITTGNITADIESSGDLDFLDPVPVDAHHTKISGHQDIRGTGHREVWGKDKDKEGAGVTSNNEPESTGYIDIGEEDKAKDHVGFRDIPKKDKDMSQDPERTAYSDKDGTKNRELDDEGSGYTGFLGKEEEDVATRNGNTYHDIIRNSSTDILENMEDARVDPEGTEDYTYLPNTDEVKTIKETPSSHVEELASTKEHKKCDLHILTGGASSCVEDPDTTEGHKEDKDEGSIIDVRHSSPVDRSGFTKTHKKDGSDVDKSNRNAPEGTFGISYTEASEKGRNITGIRFRVGKNDLKERGAGYSKDLGNGVSIETSTGVPTRKTENIAHKYIRGEDDSPLYASQDLSKHIHQIKKTDEIHTFYILGSKGNVIKRNKSKKNNAGTGRRYAAKGYQGNDRILRRKGICHDKKDQSAKSFHGNSDDSSQSSDSQKSSRSDSHQSYEGYQNHQPGSYQAAQGIQEEEHGLSAESNLSDNHS